MSDSAVPPHVVVAPRELADVVYRCARTAGVLVGPARTLATRWVEAAIVAAGTDHAQAARNGLPVDREAFWCLCRSAEAFLVSETVLDQIADLA